MLIALNYKDPKRYNESMLLAFIHFGISPGKAPLKRGT